ncbi:MAG: hypothetical protein ABSD59_16120 [Terracidiphilus sp.]
MKLTEEKLETIILDENSDRRALLGAGGGADSWNRIVDDAEVKQ